MSFKPAHVVSRSRCCAFTVRTMATQAPAHEPAVASYKPRYIDIGINLADPIFRGVYHGSRRHADDLDGVISRAHEVGCSKLIVTGSDFKSTRSALKLAAEYPGSVFATAGIHPCSSSVFSSGAPSPESEHSTPCEPDPSEPVPDHQPDPVKSAQVISQLTTLLGEARSSGQNQLVALGEFGLDYDRLHYCGRAVQRHSFAAQLRVAAALDPPLPLFLHSRAAHRDFVAAMKTAFGDRLERMRREGVVHSFTGTAEEMRELMELGLYIGINGCSFKTEANCAVVREVRLDRLMIETDGPWCEVRPSHEGYKYLMEKKPAPEVEVEPEAAHATETAAQAQKQQSKRNQNEPKPPARYKTVKKEKWVEGAMVKGRNEPCSIELVARIVAGIKGVSEEEVCEAAWHNTVKVFSVGN